MRRALLLCLCVLPICCPQLALAEDPADAAAAGAGPTREACLAAVADARKIAEALPAEDVSRYFAERSLQQALSEAGNGEFDDCLEWAARATTDAKEQRHKLPPGVKLKVLQPDERP